MYSPLQLDKYELQYFLIIFLYILFNKYPIRSNPYPYSDSSDIYYLSIFRKKKYRYDFITICSVFTPKWYHKKW